MTYEELLASAPEHETPEFIEFLRENNRVVRENDEWLVIENTKYHSPAKPWYTAFFKGKIEHNGFCSWDQEEWLTKWYGDWEWLKKSAERQTVKRYHIHIYKP